MDIIWFEPSCAAKKVTTDGNGVARQRQLWLGDRTSSQNEHAFAGL